MSTLVTSVRQSVAIHWLVFALAGAVLVAALVTSLVIVMTGGSSGAKPDTATTVSNSGGPSLTDNSSCRSRGSFTFGAC